MVLRGAQFQRSGPAGWTFLTRRALASYHALFVQGRLDTVCLPQRSLITRKSDAIPRRRFVPSQPHEGLASRAREGDLCHGVIGES